MLEKNTLMLSKSKKTNSSTNSSFTLLIEYCFCVFTLLILDSLRIVYGGLGVQRYTILLSLAASILVVIRVSKAKHFIKPIRLILALGIITSFTFLRNYDAHRNIYELLLAFYSYHLIYYLLTFTFLCYPPLLFAGKQAKDYKIFFKNFLLVISLSIPMLYMLLGSTINTAGVIITENQAEAGLIYNNYLNISDTLLLSSLLFLSTRRDLLALLIYLINVIFLILIGSRITVLIGLTTLPIFIIFIIGYYYTEIKSVLRNSRLGKVPSNFITFILLVFPLITIFLMYFSEQIFDILNLDNLISSRVFLYSNKSRVAFEITSGRGYIFQCFINNHLSSFEKTMLGGPSDMGCSNVNYLHSTLSILVNSGIVGFLIYVYLVFTLIKPLLFKAGKTIRLNSELNFQLIFHIVTAVSFLFLGLSSRAGISLWLPALAFCYSSAKIARSESKNLPLNQPGYFTPGEL